MIKNFTTKETFFSIIILLFSLSLALLFSEGFLRFKNLSMQDYNIEMWKYAKKLKQKSDNPILGHEHIPNSRATLQSVDIRINNQGMRGKDVPLKKNGSRVMFLGSSITLGWGVKEDETLTEILNNSEIFKKNNVEFLNAGIGNYNTVRYVELFLTKLKKYKPDKIIIQYFINDAENLKSGNESWLLRNSQLAVTVWILINNFFIENGEQKLINHYKKIYSHNEESYKNMLQSLQKITDYSKSKNIKLYLAMTPDIHNLKNYPFSFIHKDIEIICKDMGINYIDLLPSFKKFHNQSLNQSLLAIKGDPHPNALGHKIMADTILKTLTVNK